MTAKLISIQEHAAETLKKQVEEAREAAAREAELLANKTAMTEVTETDITIQGNTTGSKQDSGIPKKKVLKPKMTAKERKERDVGIFF
jgi:DASH complex subunit DAM1